MEPWQQEALEQQRYFRRRRQRCQCCDEPVDTELWLDLEPFGIRAVACERCVDRHMQPVRHWKEEL